MEPVGSDGERGTNRNDGKRADRRRRSNQVMDAAVVECIMPCCCYLSQ